MSRLLTRAVTGLLVLVLLPALLVNGGWLIAGLLAVLLLIVVFGGKLGIELLKNKHIGAKAGASQADVRQALTGAEDDDWTRSNE
jgi:hypothetical protein